MHKYLVILIFFSALISSCKNSQPEIEKKPVTEIYFGEKIVDPYRNLENLEDSSVVKYIKKYNTYTENKLATLKEQKKKLVQLQNDFEKIKLASYKSIVYINDNILFLKRNANENEYKLYFKNTKKGINETLLFDPTDFTVHEEKELKINYFKSNWDFSNIAISLTKNDKEFSKIVILDVQKRKVRPNVITNCSPTLVGGINWLGDNSGFIYTRFQDTVITKEVYFNSKSVLYQLSQDTTGFKNVFSKSNNPELDIQESDFPIANIYNNNDKYAIASVRNVTPYYDAYYTSSDKVVNTSWKPLFKKSEKIKDFFLLGDSLIYKTSRNAANFKICKTSILNSKFENPIVLVSEKKDRVIQEYTLVNNQLFFSTIKNGIEAKMYTKTDTGEEIEILLPFPSGKISFEKKNENYLLPIIIQGWTTPKTRYVYNTLTKKFELDTTYPSYINTSFDDVIVEEVLVTSGDGEEIPLSLVYKKGLQKNGTTPVLMRAYGSYGISMTPSFYYGFLLWAQQGGIYAVAHVRGGGEKGDTWYRGGFKKTKPNSWKDFTECTEYLIDQGYTSSEKMAIWSGSAGGIVIGRAITERPDLFAAVIIDRGSLNTVRLDEGANGVNNSKEFGSIKDSTEFRGLLAMDSYHHIKDNIAYPSVLITTGMNDTRLPPWHSIKFATRLKNATVSKNPILLKTEFNSGHGMVFSKKNEEFNMVANVFSFAFWQTGHPDYQPEN